MDNPSQQAADRIKKSNSVLVTVSTNPSVDQLAACIALTLIFNKMNKHATAVFSGEVPSTIEFLKPEDTIEKTTDSLRDFIIALDKSKADKLRYKVEDRVVRIFITPYKTSITQDDLEFSQGDPSVDTVIALGVHNQADIDQAITAHGRILHDATVITVNTAPGGELGGINWTDNGASSLSEMSVLLINLLDQRLIDSQIATALLTGIVSATSRFSNPQTYPQTMTVSAELLAAGADQQLVAAKLDASVPDTQPIELPRVEQPPQVAETIPEAREDLELARPLHREEQPAAVAKQAENPEDAEAPQIHIDEQGSIIPLNNKPEASFPVDAQIPPSQQSEPPKVMTEPPAMAGSAAGTAEQPPLGSYLGNPTPPAESSDSGEEVPSGGSPKDNGFIVGGAGNQQLTSQPVMPGQPTPEETLSDIEKSVHSPHVGQPLDGVSAPQSDVNNARDAVSQAIDGSAAPAAGQFDAQGIQLQHDGRLTQVPAWSLPTDGPSPVGNSEPIVVQPYPSTGEQQLPPPVAAAPSAEEAQPFDPNAPPPVPPPMMPPFR